jgi:hypothetical protein
MTLFQTFGLEIRIHLAAHAPVIGAERWSSSLSSAGIMFPSKQSATVFIVFIAL